METHCGKNTDTLRKQLLMNISEILFERELISEEEKNRMKIFISDEKEWQGGKNDKSRYL